MLLLSVCKGTNIRMNNHAFSCIFIQQNDFLIQQTITFHR